MNSGPRWLRLAAGVAVLLILVSIGFLLVPSYTANWKLQSYLTELIENVRPSDSPDSFRAEVVNKAASLGLPVHSNDVHIEVSPGAIRIEVPYVVRVDVAGYAVDLHFRPTARSD